ncbi:GxxExxY protein, partial [bacterium]|nr:GxxExxY protein [bacterium]
MELIYRDLTEKLRGCIFDVHNKLGVGYDEETYHQALIRRFQEKGDIPFMSQEIKWLLHRNLPIRMFKLDFLTFDKIILLLKCIQSGFIQPNYVQMISELKLWQKHLGLMVNVGLPKVNIKRIPFTEKDKKLWEDYSYIQNRMTEPERQLLLRLRDAILFVYECHGLGYGKVVCRKLVETELTFQKTRFEKHATIAVKYNDEIIRNFKMRFLLVEEQVILGVTALQREVNYEIITMQTYLKALGLSVGMLVNF